MSKNNSPAYFITCNTKSIKYRGDKIPNNPVNIAVCKNIRKGNFAWYPDNTGRPSIVFKGCDEEWVYDRKEDRDDDFLLISNNEI